MTATCDSSLEVAKERLRIPDLWRELGLEGEPKKDCRCPFHEDKSPSFSVFDDGSHWKCHVGCGEGSVIDFYAKAKGTMRQYRPCVKPTRGCAGCRTAPDS
jgi:DNA primase (bacterial type)